MTKRCALKLLHGILCLLYCCISRERQAVLTELREEDAQLDCV